MEAWARYEKKESYEGLDLAALASMLGGTFTNVKGFEGYTQTQTTSSLLGAFNAAQYPDGSDITRPNAYLNYIVYDDAMVYQDAGWIRVGEDAGFEPGNEGAPNSRLHKRLRFSSPVEISQNGYIYIWVSNQSEATKVWFDDLKVSHTQHLVTQATDYGVWGDVLREQKSDENLYRFGYQGQFAEKDEETGWNHFELREYDPVIGRWMVPDPASQHWSPYLAMGNIPNNKTDEDGSWDGYQSPTNGWQRFWNWASGHSYLNRAYDYLTSTPENEVVKSVAYFPGAVVFIIDKLDEEGNVRFADHVYTFEGEDVYQQTFDFFLDPREDLGIPTDNSNPNIKYAGALKVEGWIAKKLFRRLGDSDLRQAFVTALKKGRVSSFEGAEGIKPLAGKGIKGSDGVNYLYELKVLGQHGKQRLLGNMEKWSYKSGGKIITKDIVIFRNWLTK